MFPCSLPRRVHVHKVVGALCCVIAYGEQAERGKEKQPEALVFPSCVTVAPSFQQRATVIRNPLWTRIWMYPMCTRVTRGSRLSNSTMLADILPRNHGSFLFIFFDVSPNLLFYMYSRSSRRKLERKLSFENELFNFNLHPVSLDRKVIISCSN